MANLYAKLKRKITENGIDVIYTEPLSYVNSVLPRNGTVMSSKPQQKVIIVCKKVNATCILLLRPNADHFLWFHLQEHFMPTQTKSKLTKKKVSNENNSNDLNLTGSPLRDTCDIDYINESMDSSLGWNNLWAEEDESYRPISIIRAQYV